MRAKGTGSSKYQDMASGAMPTICVTITSGSNQVNVRSSFGNVVPVGMTMVVGSSEVWVREIPRRLDAYGRRRRIPWHVDAQH